MQVPSILVIALLVKICVETNYVRDYLRCLDVVWIVCSIPTIYLVAFPYITMIRYLLLFKYVYCLYILIKSLWKYNLNPNLSFIRYRQAHNWMSTFFTLRLYVWKYYVHKILYTKIDILIPYTTSTYWKYVYSNKSSIIACCLTAGQEFPL